MPEADKLLQTWVITDASPCTKAIKEAKWGFGHKIVPHADRQSGRGSDDDNCFKPSDSLNYYEFDWLCFPDLTLQIAEVEVIYQRLHKLSWVQFVPGTAQDKICQSILSGSFTKTLNFVAKNTHSPPHLAPFSSENEYHTVVRKIPHQATTCSSSLIFPEVMPWASFKI